MTPIENSPQGAQIAAFLGASREYLGLRENRTVVRSPSLVSIMTAKLQRPRMNSYRKIVQSLLLAAGVGVFVAGPVMAEQGCGHMGGNPEGRAKMMEQHHNHLHDALKLTAEQEPAWKKLMESEAPRPALSGGQPEDWAKLNAPERAEKMLELSKARQVQMTEHVAALKAFYATLTPEQQKAFEDFHNAPRGRMSGKPAPKAADADKPAGKP